MNVQYCKRLIQLLHVQPNVSTELHLFLPFLLSCFLAPSFFGAATACGTCCRSLPMTFNPVSFSFLHTELNNYKCTLKRWLLRTQQPLMCVCLHVRLLYFLLYLSVQHINAPVPTVLLSFFFLHVCLCVRICVVP